MVIRLLPPVRARVLRADDRVDAQAGVAAGPRRAGHVRAPRPGDRGILIPSALRFSIIFDATPLQHGTLQHGTFQHNTFQQLSFDGLSHVGFFDCHDTWARQPNRDIFERAEFESEIQSGSRDCISSQI